MADETFAERQARLGAATQNPTADAPAMASNFAASSGALSPNQRRIADYFKQSTGRDATQQEYSQWGDNIDEAYHAKIRSAIDNTDEAKKYKADQANPRAPDAPPPPAADGSPPVPQSPVSGTGKIPEAPPAAPQAPPSLTPQVPQAVSGNRNIDMSKVTDMPTYQAAQFQNTLANAAPAPDAYGGSQISQFQAPDQSAMNAQQSNLLNSVMSNPETMGVQQVAQMKEQQKEQALLMAQQNKGQYAQSAVARGVLGSGQADAFRGMTDNNATNQVLTGNRDIDMYAARTNRADQLAALQASSAIGQDQLGRATQGYGATLSGQTAKAADTQAASQSAMQRWLAGDTSALSHAQFGHGVDVDNATQQYQQYQSKAEASKDMYARALSAAQNSQANYGQDLQAELGRGAGNLARDQFGQQNYQFDAQQQQWLKAFLENQRQFNTNNTLNYDQLNSNNAFRGTTQLGGSS